MREERQVLFAAKIIGTGENTTMELVRRPGALNIESLCSDRDRLLIGFRNPTIHMEQRDYALIIPMLNPEAVVRGTETTKFGRPVLLNLSGLGIRDMAPCIS
jgi:hypothetical protein